MKRRNTQVQWNVGESPAAAGRKAPPPRYKLPQDPDAELAAGLVPGAMFQARWDLYDASPSNNNTPFPVLTPAEYDTTGYSIEQRRAWYPVLRGDIVLYAGTVRHEAEGKAGMLRVTRHTIIAGGRRFIVEKLSALAGVGGHNVEFFVEVGNNDRDV